MLRWAALAGLALAATAQVQQAPAIASGVLLERDSEITGELLLRSAGNHVFRFQYDAATAIDRGGVSSDIQHLRPGDRVEIASRDSGGPFRYAATIHAAATATPPARRTPAISHLRAYSSMDDRAAGRGDLTFAGVIASLTAARLVLHTRAHGEQTILLRADTRFIDNGGLAGAAALKPNMRVFVRGGRNLYGDVEGYQVMWGGILEVR